MSYIKFLNSDEHLNGNVKIIDDHTVEVSGCNQNLSGFQLFTDADFMFGDYSKYKYDYEEPNLGNKVYRYTNDNHKWKKPIYTTTFNVSGGGTAKGALTQKVEKYEDLVIPTITPNENYVFDGWNPTIPSSGYIDSNKTFVAMFTYIEPLESVKQRKVNEMNQVQQQTIENGFNATLTDGTVEHFTLTGHDQTSLLGLAGQVQAGIEQIPWHTSDHDEPCKYYSNADMKIITDMATIFVTLQVTYFRDLRIYINKGLNTKEEVEAVEYGIMIPEEYQSEVLKNLLMLNH